MTETYFSGIVDKEKIQEMHTV